MAHLLNGCKETFRNFYSSRHNRIPNYLYDQFRTTNRRSRSYNNKLIEIIFLEQRNYTDIQKSDIISVDLEL